MLAVEKTKNIRVREQNMTKKNPNDVTLRYFISDSVLS